MLTYCQTDTQTHGHTDTLPSNDFSNDVWVFRLYTEWNDDTIIPRFYSTFSHKSRATFFMTLSVWHDTGLTRSRYVVENDYEVWNNPSCSTTVWHHLPVTNLYHTSCAKFFSILCCSLKKSWPTSTRFEGGKKDFSSSNGDTAVILSEFRHWWISTSDF